MGLVGVPLFPYVFPLISPALSGDTQKERVKSLAPQRIADTKGNQRTAAAMHYVTQGKREVLWDRFGQLRQLPPPSVGIASTRQVGLTYSRAGGEQQGGHAA